MECTQCNTYINTYIPQEHQESLHKDTHRYIGNFGGYGTGKTLTSRQEVYKHCFITPNANVLVGANVVSQYEQTIKRELENDIPAAFVKDYSVQKAYMDLLNGSRILYRPLADSGKLRSYNLTMFVIVEASEVPTETFSQLKTRTRNTAAAKQATDEDGKPLYKTNTRGVEIPIYSADWRKGIVESNPDSGWIRSGVLLIAANISKHGTVLDEFIQIDADKDPATAAHIASTDVNKYLPESFIPEIIKNKPAWWVSRYVFGSFSYAEGLVYPRAIDYVKPSFEIPPDWRRIIAFDYGIHDKAAYVFCAIDPKEGILHVYKEAVTSDQNIESLAKLYFDNISDIPSGGLLCPPIIDPKSSAKRDYNLKTLGDHFLEEGIAFEPGYINLDARILRLNTYFEAGRIHIHSCCTELIGELKEYKYKPQTLDNKVGENKPVDKNNHTINPLEWIVMRLPSNPKNILFGAYDSAGRDLTEEQEVKKFWLPHALQDEEPEEHLGFSYVKYLK